MLLKDSKAGVSAAVVICSCALQQASSGNEAVVLPGLHLSTQEAREQGSIQQDSLEKGLAWHGM